MKLAPLTLCRFVLALVLGIANRAEPGLDEAMLLLNVPAAHGAALYATLAALVFACLTPYTLRYCLEIKHY